MLTEFEKSLLGSVMDKAQELYDKYKEEHDLPLDTILTNEQIADALSATISAMAASGTELSDKIHNQKVRIDSVNRENRPLE